MVNSIRSSRRRPRRRSVTTLTFGWVLAREAFYRLTASGTEGAAADRAYREQLCNVETWKLRQVAEQLLRAWPDRRVRP